MELIEPYQGIAKIYDEIRPDYPIELIEDIITHTGINQSSHLLEVGAGTGKATMMFATRNFKVKAIELSDDMAIVLKDKSVDFVGIDVEVSSFEEWQNRDEVKFDMIFSAQAFHWIDPSVKFIISHELLKSDGYLVLFWYIPTEDTSSFGISLKLQMDKIIQKYKSDSNHKGTSFLRKKHDGKYSDDERMIELQNCDLFDLLEKKEYSIEINNKSDDYLKALKSVPEFASIRDSMDNESAYNLDKELIQLIDANGGYVKSKIQYTLYILKKRRI